MVAVAAPSRRPSEPLVMDVAPTPLDSPRVRTTPLHTPRRASFVPVAARIAQTLQVVGFGDRRQSRDAPQPARRVRKICGLATAGGSGRGGAHPGGLVGEPGVRRQQIASQSEGAQSRAAADGVVMRDVFDCVD